MPEDLDSVADECSWDDPHGALCLIFMATYNGIDFIDGQVQSIRNQSEPRWLLLASDDDSTDGTFEFLEEAAAEDPRVRVVRNEGVHGAYANFFSAVRLVKSELADSPESKMPPYLFFADQDDIWESDKIAVMTAELARIEASSVGTRPALCYSNRLLIDGDGAAFGQTIDSGDRAFVDNPLSIFFFRGSIAGCAMAFNRALMDVTACPEEADSLVAHDAYFAMGAAAFGSVSYIERPLTRYRRHGGNASRMKVGRYGFAEALRAIASDMPEKRRLVARRFWSSLVFLHQLPEDNDVTREVRGVLDTGGVRAVRWCLSHHVCAHCGVLARVNTCFALLTRAYRKTEWFTDPDLLACIDGVPGDSASPQSQDGDGDGL